MVSVWIWINIKHCESDETNGIQVLHVWQLNLRFQFEILAAHVQHIILIFQR